MSEIDADAVAGSGSWRHLIDPERWARECRDTSIDYFEARVRNMDSDRHLQAALDAEAAREEPRPARIATINQQRAAIQDNES